MMFLDFSFVFGCFGLFRADHLNVGPYFRFSMLCSVLLLDLRCNYVDFSFFQVLRVFSGCIDRLGCLIAFRLFWVVLGCPS